ncbi:MFS-type transporter SLC18B1-like [Asterias rubens]|uniref:MFS-type transporter SLC18B1-like n=1 Tax=Asterias rubens TaxID=7604 RepID=UPI001454EDAE|nr:MFS-type transporter SLC18B1-like [Asterias rubens]
MKPVGVEGHHEVVRWYKWLEFVTISALYTSIWSSASIIAPFFPPEAIRKGANQASAGIVLGAFSITSFLVASPFGSLVQRIGGKNMFLLGAGFCGCTNIVFGLLGRIDDSTSFIASALILRIIEAVGSSAALVAAMSIIGGHHTHYAPQMLGLLDMFSGLAFMIGPMVGTLLYQAGGFELPFFTLGGLCILLTALNGVVLQGKETKIVKDDAPTSLLRVPAIWPVAFALFMSTASLAVFNVGIAYHTEKIGLLPAGHAGVPFFIQGSTYAISTAVFGMLVNKLVKQYKSTTRVMLVLGYVLSSVPFMMIGPSPWLPFIPSNLLVLSISCVLIGLSMGVVCVPSITDIVLSAERKGLPSGSAAYGMASGVFLSCFHLGSFVGSTCGGTLIDRYDFELTTSLFAMGNLTAAVVIASFSVWEFQCGKRNAAERSSDWRWGEWTEQPMTPLLTEEDTAGSSL